MTGIDPTTSREEFSAIVPDKIDRDLLLLQEEHMTNYYNTLNKRIARFQFDKYENKEKQ